ncbi:hypothetical protein NPIL_255881 [Nephila pilipes]|uniref:Uncharacterized protein n=1 Tax=Nephila pilipes TaxID=299642 RepID=A0A8X6PSG8_NEPPI|nr:hypothetical protein NPIL_255881 [Nephila pilipes]
MIDSKSLTLYLKEVMVGESVLGKYAGGHGRSTILQEDGYVSLMAKKNRHLIPCKLSLELAIIISICTFARTIFEQLNPARLYTWKPVKYI